jgi:hypothetical protein
MIIDLNRSKLLIISGVFLVLFLIVFVSASNLGDRLKISTGLFRPSVEIYSADTIDAIISEFDDSMQEVYLRLDLISGSSGDSSYDVNLGLDNSRSKVAIMHFEGNFNNCNSICKDKNQKCLLGYWNLLYENENGMISHTLPIGCADDFEGGEFSEVIQSYEDVFGSEPSGRPWCICS